MKHPVESVLGPGLTRGGKFTGDVQINVPSAAVKRTELQCPSCTGNGAD